MRVLGVDPGTIKAGLAVVDDGRLVASEQINLGDSDVPMVWRVGRLFTAVFRYCQIYLDGANGDFIALENGFIGRNPQSGLTIGLARGAVLAAAHACGLDVHMFHPATVKRITGHGNATKARIQQVMTFALKPDHELGEDEADACAIALAGEMEAKREQMAKRYTQTLKPRKKHGQHG